LSVKFNDRYPPDFAYFATVQEFYIHGTTTAEPAGTDAPLACDFFALAVNEDKGKLRQALYFFMYLRKVNHDTKIPRQSEVVKDKKRLPFE
jgi:hypothetical protein